MYKVNFLPTKLQREGVIDIKRLLTVTAATLLIAMGLGSYGIFVINFLNTKNELALKKQQYNSLIPIVNRVENIKSERKELEATGEEYKYILAGYTTWSDLFFGLSSITPVDLWLTELQVTYKQTDQNAKGNSTQKSASSPPDTGAAKNAKQASSQKQKDFDVFPLPEIVIFKGYSLTVPSIGIFINNLYHAPRFDNVKLNRIITENEAIKFEITAYVKDVEQQ